MKWALLLVSIASAQTIPFPGPGRAPSCSTFNLLGHDAAGAGSATGGSTLPNITTGATVAIIAASWYGTGGVTVSDSKGNIYTGLAPQQNLNTFNSQIYFKNHPVVGSGHTFTIAGVGAALEVLYFGGCSSGFDTGVENGNFHDGALSIQTGDITTTVPQELVVTALTSDPAAGIPIIDSGMIAFTLAGAVSLNLGVAIAYKVLPSPAPINPLWSWPTLTPVAAAIGAFKP